MAIVKYVETTDMPVGWNRWLLLLHYLGSLIFHVCCFSSSHLFYNFNKLRSSEACTPGQTLNFSHISMYNSIQLSFPFFSLSFYLSILKSQCSFLFSIFFLSSFSIANEYFYWRKKKSRNGCHESFMWINISFATIFVRPIKAYKLSMLFSFHFSFFFGLMLIAVVVPTVLYNKTFQEITTFHLL